MCKTNIANLNYIGCGKYADNPIGHLCSKRFDSFLDKAKENFDFMKGRKAKQFRYPPEFLFGNFNCCPGQRFASCVEIQVYTLAAEYLPVKFPVLNPVFSELL